MGCSLSRVRPQVESRESAAEDDAAVPSAAEAAPRTRTTTAAESASSSDWGAEVEPFTPGEPVPATERSTAQMRESESVQPSQVSMTPSPRSTPSLSPPLFTPPAPTSLPRQSILKKDGRKKDWEAIRAAKHMSSPQSPHRHIRHDDSIDEDDDSKQQHDDEHKQKPTDLNHSPESPRRAIVQPSPSATPRPAALHTMVEEKSADGPQQPAKEKTPTPSPTHTATASRQYSFKTGRRGKRRTSHQGMMSKLALQFPAIRESFDAVFTSFRQFCDLSSSSASVPAVPSSLSGLGHITLSQFPDLLSHLTHHTQTFSSQHVADLFAASHLATRSSTTLSFRECLIAVALGYYLAPASPASAGDPSFERIGRGFHVVRRAFQDIDDDGSGRLDASEMKQALFAASSGSSRDDVLQARFKELDLNGDGDVEFQEFLYGVVSWVGLTTEEEMDEIEQSA